MKEYTKKIRTDLCLNQEQLSQLLGVSPITVNRWENGKATPNLIAQKQLYEICKKHDIRLEEFMIERIMSGCGEHTLYHASRLGITGSIQPISRSKCDFGRGFYMGTDPLQPLTLVCNEEKPVFYTMDLNPDGLRCLDVEVGIDWAMLIAFFRGYMDNAKGTAIYEKFLRMAEGYDVMIGYIANDRMYQVLTDFFEERITDTALIGSLSALKLGKQYVAITQKACDQITIREEKVLSKLELMVLKDVSIIRRKDGLELADRIIKEHRRDGRYFDEILKGVEA